MAVPRYTRVLQGLRGYSAQKNYIDWLTGTSDRLKDSNIGKGDPRPESQILYIRPFGFGAEVVEADNEYPDKHAVRVSANKATYNARKDLVLTAGNPLSDYVKTVLPTNGNSVNIGGFKPAKAIITTGRSATATAKTSRITRRPYGSYGGKSTSLPFGIRTAATGKPEASAEATDVGVFALIRTAIIAGSTGSPPSVTFQPERFPTD